MVKKTHLAGGMLAGALAMNTTTDITQIVIGVGLAMAGSLLCDIDTATSAYGRKIPGKKHKVVGKNGKVRYVKKENIISKVFKHRTFTHSILFVFLIWTLIQEIIHIGGKYNIDLSILQLFTYGVISHIALDLLNYQGLALLYPLPDKFSLPLIRIKTGSGGDTFVGILCIALSLVLFINPNLWMGTVVPMVQQGWSNLIAIMGYEKAHMNVG